jgi:uncharacterized membrane protein YgcG
LHDVATPLRGVSDGEQMKLTDARSTQRKRTALDAYMLFGAAMMALGIATTAALAQDQRGSMGVTSGQGDIVVSTARIWGGNKDGAYTCDEWKQYLSRMYNLADSKHVGFITAADFVRVKRASPVFANADFDFFDTSGKGKISRKDFIAQPSPFFTRFDTKASCRVTEADIQKVLAAEKQPKAPEGGRGGGRRGGGGGRGGGMGGGGMGGGGMGGGGVNF